MNPIICTLKGQPFNLVDPDPRMIDIQEIAHSLSHGVRWTGHSKHRMSIGQHSIMVYGKVFEQTRDPDILLAALLHDASEAYTGDISTPLGFALGETWHNIKFGIEAAVFEAFNLPLDLYKHPLIKAADNFLYRWERNSFFPYQDWWPYFSTDDLPTYPISTWTAEFVQSAFLHTFHQLQEKRNASRQNPDV